MQFYVTLTLDCNLKCRYCYGKCCEESGEGFEKFNIDYSLPTSISYEISQLKNFCKKDEDLTLIFYGGEPLLRADKMKEIIDEVPAKRYILQTNGLLLDKLEPNYANKLHTILVSVDGNEQLTDYYRGEGVYRRVVENVKLLRQRGFKGEIIARMTVSDKTGDVFKQVLWLLFNRECPFDSVHWQLDALFWRNDFKNRGFLEWALKKYNPQVKMLVDFWVKRMEKWGSVLKIYPLVGVTHSLLLGEKSKLRCGAGWTTFNIQTDGNITPCPVMAGMKDFYLGNIRNVEPRELKDAFFVSEPCTKCPILDICGGRCLYANVTKLWGEEGFRQVCLTVKNLVNCIMEALPRIKRLISKGRLSINDFDYAKFNSCEIIP